MSSKPDKHSGIISHSLLWYFSTLSSSSSLSPTSHITTCYIHHFSFLSSLLTRHYPCFTLSGIFLHITASRSVTSFPQFTSWEVVQRSYFEMLSCQWGFVLHQYMGSVYSCGYVFHGRSFIIDQSMQKKRKKIAHSPLYRFPFTTCMDVSVCFIEFMC